jgi:hypothetical protein
LSKLRDLARKHFGDEIVIYATDPYGTVNFTHIDGVFQTSDFSIDEDPEAVFALLRETQPKGPVMDPEFYTGWFCHWGEPDCSREGGNFWNGLNVILRMKASINFYIYTGGTNFAYYNGANDAGEDIIPSITSYDYDAPVDERGSVRAKFFEIRNLIAKYNGIKSQLPIIPSPDPLIENDISVPLTFAGSMFDFHKLKTLHSLTPLSMEQARCAYGFILYESVLQKDNQYGFKITLPLIRDIAKLYINGKHVLTLGRMESNTTQYVDGAFRAGDRLSILVENVGRLNFGQRIVDPKGIIGDVLIDGLPHLFWELTCITLPDDFLSHDWNQSFVDGPAIFTGSFRVDELPMDSYVVIPGTKGVISVNGFILGRYNSAGPQRSLYLPSAVLHQGENSVCVFELEKLSSFSITLTDSPRPWILHKKIANHAYE